jgi:hypothetical protein
MFDRLRKIDPVYLAIGVLLIVIWAVIIPLLF